MTNRIKLLADRALAGNPPDIKIDLSGCVKVFGENEQKPKLLCEAAALCCYLTEYVPEIREGDLLLGDVRLNLLGYIPGFGTPMAPMPERLKEGENKLWMMCGNHKTADFKRVIQIGLAGYLENIRKSKQKFAADKEKTEFLTALEMVCRAVAQSAQNYANLCARMAESEDDPARKAELSRMAEIGARVPFHPAESFYEAVQSYWFIFSLFPDGVGRLDQYLNPFYEKDLKSGKITRAFALELIEALFVKIFERVGPSQPWSGDNHMVAAGYREDGSCGFCPVTELVLEAVCDLPTWRPQVTVRWTKNTPFEDFLKAVLANQKQSDLVMFTNDEQIMTGLGAIGVPFRDAVEFSLSGCNELVLTGMSQMGSLEGHLNVMHALEAAMADKQALEHLTSYEAFFAHLCTFLKQDVELCVALSEYWDRERGKSVDLLSSLFTDGCIENAASIGTGGAKYNFCTWCAAGLLNLADSLSVIRQFVFEEKVFTLAQLSGMLDKNWQGFAKERARILKEGRFFGNDIDAADTIVNQLTEKLNSFVENKTPVRGGRYTFGTLVGYELAHVVLGKETGASCDGRFAGDAFYASICSEKDKNGITAYLKSVAKIDFTAMPSSVVVNLKLDRAMADSPEKLERLARLVETYFKMGGVQLQINYVSQDDLINAQKCPEKYQNLRVRVTGFSGFFTQFDAALQNEIIKRTQHHA